MEALRLERLRRRAGAPLLALVLRLAVPFALLALYAASSGSRPRTLTVSAAEGARLPRGSMFIRDGQPPVRGPGGAALPRSTRTP
jgi:hypothetical protein